jgi:hypothetical protein
LFDLENDPDELNDLSSDPRQQAVLIELQRKLTAWFTPRIQAYQASIKRKAD